MSSTPQDQPAPLSWTDESLPLLVRRQLLVDDVRRVKERKAEAASARRQAPADAKGTDDSHPGS